MMLKRLLTMRFVAGVKFELQSFDPFVRFRRFGHVQRLNFYGILVIILFNECLLYYLQRFRWESIACETDECNRVLFVADPQILGEERESRWLARYDNDRHINRNYRQAFSHVKPDVVIFLGDLIGRKTLY